MSDLDAWNHWPSAVHILSLGAGVQSSTLALMASRGLITPKPTAAIFADTQAEPASVYSWLSWLEKQLDFPVYRVTHGNLAEKDLRTQRSKKSGKIYRSSKIPAFTLETTTVTCSCVGDDEVPDPGCGLCNGKGSVRRESRGLLPRKCTLDYKIQPIFRKARELGGVPRQKRSGVYVVQWIGISTDEVLRMKPSRESWAVNRWPLIEMGISRQMCLEWWAKEKLPTPPRSACVFCPYHNDNEWVRLKTEEPVEFDRAVKFERRMQKAHDKTEVSRGVPFLHRSCIPIDKVKFEPKEKPTNLFNNECEGMCGA